MDHSHEKHPHVHASAAGRQGKGRLWWVLLLVTLYMLAEVAGGLYTGSLALLADAGHMAIDAAAIGLSLFAAWIAHKPATEEKTYGYYRAEILAALLNGMVLVAVSFWIFFEASSRIAVPEIVNGKAMLFVALGGLFVNLTSLYVLRGGHSHGDLNVHGVWLHVFTDTLGSVSAIIAGVLIWRYGWNLADSITSIAIAAFILFGSWRLLTECVNVLLEGTPRGLSITDIKRSIESVTGVKNVHDFHVWTVTSGVPSLSAHVSLHEAADHLKVLVEVTEILKERFQIEHTTLQLEPSDFAHPWEKDHCNLGH